MLLEQATLLMGAKPSSAVQQSAHLEALDQCIDCEEDGTLRGCLTDENGIRLKDENGFDKTLRMAGLGLFKQNSAQALAPRDLLRLAYFLLLYSSTQKGPGHRGRVQGDIFDRCGMS
jgi:hypothetical protein